MAIESLGEAVTGSMIARAIEPEAGESTDQGQRVCLNCGAALTGPYCSQCGQKGHVHRSLRGFGHDLLHSVFHFEGKIWRTLPMLAWRPGEVTRRYIDGERARFVSPIALFLFSVFLMFAVFSTLGGPFRWETNTPAVNEARQEMQQEQAERASTIARLEQQRRSLTARGQPTRSVDQQLANLREEQAVIGAAQQFQKATTSEGGLTKAREIDLNELQVNTGWPWLDQAVHHAAENPALLVYKLQSSAYKFSWALIPLSVPFVWMLFLWRRGYRLYDHTVFVTYSIAFMTLLVVALSLVRPILGTDSLSGAALTFIPPWHMYRQLRGAYRLRPLSAIWRTAFLLVFASVAATLFFLLLLTMGLLG